MTTETTIYEAEKSIAKLTEAMDSIAGAIGILESENVVTTELRFFVGALAEKIEFREGAMERMRKSHKV